MAPAMVASSSTTISLPNSILRHRTSGGFFLFSPSNVSISSSPFSRLNFKTRPLIPSFSPLKHTNSNSPSISPKRDSKLRVNGRKGGAAVVEVDESEDSEESFDFDDEIVGIEDGEEDEGVYLPFEKMNKWLENKPSGFGEGKVYDTSIEDQLFDEMSQSRKAQLANINNLKNNPINPNLKKDQKKDKAPGLTKTSARVRLFNLPKKRKVERDLKAAFQGFPGIIDISPAVSGTKKTKDPTCKGFAFVNFKSKDDATRFVQKFSGQSVEFGKISKQIRCEMVNAVSPVKTTELAVAGLSSALPVIDPGSEMREEDVVEMRYESGNAAIEMEDTRSEVEMVSATLIKSRTKLVSADKKETTNAPKKKPVAAKEKQKKVLKLGIPGSAKRLKTEEKTILTGVISKYGVKSTTASKKKP